MARSNRVGTVLVDSGAWIALLSARDQHHAEADAAFRRAIRERIRLATTNLVLAEVHRLLLFRAGIRAAALALDRIVASEHVDLVFAVEADHHAATRWMTHFDALGAHGDQRITYTDAVSFAVMKSRKCDAVLGVDHDFIVAGFPFWRAE